MGGTPPALSERGSPPQSVLEYGCAEGTWPRVSSQSRGRDGVLGTPAVFRRVYEDPIVQSKQPDSTRDIRELGEARATELNRYAMRSWHKWSHYLNFAFIKACFHVLPSTHG